MVVTGYASHYVDKKDPNDTAAQNTDHFRYDPRLFSSPYNEKTVILVNNRRFHKI